MSKKKERSEWFNAIDHLNLGADTPTNKDIKANDTDDTPSASTGSKESTISTNSNVSAGSNEKADSSKSANSNLVADANTSGEIKSKSIVKSKTEAIAIPPEEDVSEITPTVEDIAPTESSKKTRQKKKQAKEKEVSTPKHQYTSGRLRKDLYMDVQKIYPQCNKTEAMEKALLFVLANHCKELEEAQKELGKKINKYKKK